MELLKDALVMVVGKNGEVSMPDQGCVLITHSSGKHWFRIYKAAHNPELVFLLDDQGACQAVAQPKSMVVETLAKIFR